MVIDSNLIATVMTIVAGSLGYIIKKQQYRILEIKNQLSDRKYTLYHDIYSAFFDLIWNMKEANMIKVPKERENQMEKVKGELTKKLVKIKKDVFIYAPDVVLNKFLQWNTMVTEKPDDPKHALSYLQLCVEIRKDMGHPKTRIREDKILRSIMINNADYELMWRIINE